VDGAVRSRLTPDFTSRSGVITAAVGAAAVLGAVAVRSPKDAALLLVAMAFVALAVARLPLAIAVFVLLTFPEHLPGSLGAGATLAKPVGALIAVAWAGAVLTRRGELPLLPRERPLLFSAITALLVFGGVSVLWATDASQTRYALGRLLQVAVLLLVTYTAASTRAGFRTLVYGYLIASFATSLYSIASGTYNSSSGRLAGVIEPDYFAAELIPAILIACFLLVTVRSARVRWLVAAVAVVDLGAFVLTQSRGAILGLAVALVAAVVCAGRRARPRILALVLVLVAGGMGYYLIYKPAHVFQNNVGGISAASSGRLDEWNVAVRIFEGHPVGGVGLGNYQTVEPSYATQNVNINAVDYVVTDRLVAHNTYLQMAAELGLVGLFLFLAILIAPLWIGGRALATAGSRLAELEFHVRGLYAGVLGMLVAYFFLTAELEKPPWFLLALLACVPALLRDTAADE
jgi:putative inorganic carbon (hco3(-)) transporter